MVKLRLVVTGGSLTRRMKTLLYCLLVKATGQINEKNCYTQNNINSISFSVIEIKIELTISPTIPEKIILQRKRALRYIHLRKFM